MTKKAQIPGSKIKHINFLISDHDENPELANIVMRFKLHNGESFEIHSHNTPKDLGDFLIEDYPKE